MPGFLAPIIRLECWVLLGSRPRFLLVILLVSRKRPGSIRFSFRFAYSAAGIAMIIASSIVPAIKAS
jgi:hypothetical protein